MAAEDRPPSLSPVSFHVLLALSEGPLHGYGIMRAAEGSSGSEMGPGTVYGSMRRLEDSGWVKELAEVPGRTGRKRLFELTAEGHQVLRREARRLHALVELTRDSSWTRAKYYAREALGYILWRLGIRV